MAQINPPAIPNATFTDLRNAPGMVATLTHPDAILNQSGSTTNSPGEVETLRGKSLMCCRLKESPSRSNYILSLLLQQAQAALPAPRSAGSGGTISWVGR